MFLNKLLLKLPTVKSLIQQMPDIASSVLMDFTQLDQLALKFQDSVMDITSKQETVLPVNLVWNWSMENVLIEIVILSHLLKCVPHVLTITIRTQMVSVNSQIQTALLQKTENVIVVCLDSTQVFKEDVLDYLQAVCSVMLLLRDHVLNAILDLLFNQMDHVNKLPNLKL